MRHGPVGRTRSVNEPGPETEVTLARFNTGTLAVSIPHVTGTSRSELENENVDEQPHQPSPPQSRLTRRGALAGMAAVAGISAFNLGTFAWADGRFTPQSLSPSTFVDRFEQVYGRCADCAAAQGHATAESAGTCSP
jgi:hypothetical protein